MIRLVGITQRVITDPRHGERRDALDQRWIPLLASCGLTGVPLPNHPDTALSLLRHIPLAGLILTGGNSLMTVGGDAPERDTTEAALLDTATALNIPVLGVCRGAQMIWAWAGGTLTPARNHVGDHPIDGPDGPRTVNSFHDFAPDGTPPPGVTVTARCPTDGRVEAFRLGGGRIRAILWHPERDTVLHPADRTLIETHFGEDRT